jgi:beta-phosphoglucomutase-like phosphatase (HAD superfamily)
MQPVEGILFEPVGCLAEFPPEPFQDIAASVFGRELEATQSASGIYWQLLNLLEAAPGAKMEALELQAAREAVPYEDVVPALSELQGMGVKLILASSLSTAAVSQFLTSSGLGAFFTEIWSRQNAGGIKAELLRRAAASLNPQRTIFLTDTAEGIQAAKNAGLNPILMMNDPDEAMRLTAHNPAGGIVSLHELPDFVRLVAAQNARRITRVDE